MQGVEVALKAAAFDGGGAGGADIGDAAEFFAPVGVGDMDFYRRQTHCFEGVKEGDARMGVGAGVDDDPVELLVGSLDGLHEVALMVGLHKFYLYAQPLRLRPDNTLLINRCSRRFMMIISSKNRPSA